MHGELCIGDAINWDAPLNRGLVSWWLALPEQQRGVMFRDLAMRNHGSLTNGPTWTGARGRPGGWGALSIASGSGQSVSIPSLATSTISAGDFTVAGWLRLNDADDFACPFAWDSVSNAIPFNRLITVSGKFRWQYRDDAGNEIGGGSFDSTSTVTDGGWHHWAITRSGTSFALYVRGTSERTGTLTAVALTPDECLLGSFRSGTFTDGNLDDTRIYNRGLSASEVHQLYQASRRGYPNELNWLPRRWYTVQDAGGGGGLSIPIAMYHYRHHIGA